MLIYVLLVIYVILAGVSIDMDDSRGKMKYCVSVCLLLIFIIGLRNESLGLYDTQQSYVPNFNRMSSLSVSDIMMNSNYEDKGFYIFAKIFSIICNNSQAWLFIIGIPLPVAISLLIYRKLNYPYISYLLYFALGYFGYSYFLLRQVFALALCIFSYLLIEKKEKKYILAGILLFLLALTFHGTSIMFLLVFLLDRKFLKEHSNTISAIVVAIGLLFGRTILSYVFESTSWDRILGYENSTLALNNSLFYIYLLMFISVFVVRVITRYDNEMENYYLLIFSVSVFFMSLVSSVGNIYRMAVYFGVFSVVLCPNVLCGEAFTEGSRRVVKILLVLVASYVFISRQIWGANLAPYVFFWN